MNKSAKSKKRVTRPDSGQPALLVLPHWHIEGGAGFYIRDLLKTLYPHARVSVAGCHAADYDVNPVSSVFLDKLGALRFPVYVGIRPVVTVFHLLTSLCRIFQLWVVPKKISFKECPSVFIFTSSVQALSVPVTRWFFPDSRIVIVVQEQVDFSRVFGKLIAWLLQQSDVVVAITEDWAAHARKFGLDPIVLHNQYDPDYTAPELNSGSAIESDILYVGGGAKIKGLNEFAAALLKLLEPPGRRVICLGSYDQSRAQCTQSDWGICKRGIDFRGHRACARYQTLSERHETITSSDRQSTLLSSRH